MNKALFVEYTNAIGALVTTMMVIQGTLGIASLTLLFLKLFSKLLLISILVVAAVLFCLAAGYKWKSVSTTQTALKQAFDDTWKKQEITQKTKLVSGYQRTILLWAVGILLMYGLLLVELPIPDSMLYAFIIQLGVTLVIDFLGLQATQTYLQKL